MMSAVPRNSVRKAWSKAEMDYVKAAAGYGLTAEEASADIPRTATSIMTIAIRIGMAMHRDAQARELAIWRRRLASRGF